METAHMVQVIIETEKTHDATNSYYLQELILLLLRSKSADDDIHHLHRLVQLCWMLGCQSLIRHCQYSGCSENFTG